MCNPVAAMMAVSMAMSLASGVMQYKSAKDAQEAADDAAKREAKLAEEAEANQLKALEDQLAQATDKAEIEKLERQRQAIRERAKIRVAASESGGLGNSVLKQLSASAVNEGFDKGIIQNNLDNRATQIDRQKEATRINTKSQINRAKAGVPAAPSQFMAGLQIGGDMMGAAKEGYGGGAFDGLSGGGDIQYDAAKFGPQVRY
jgi:hypothetical protein